MIAATTIATWLDRYIRDNPLKPSSVEQLRIAARLFVSHCGSMPLSAVTHEHIRDWSRHLLAKGNSRTARNYVRSIYTLLRSAWHEGEIESLPRIVRMPDAPPPPPRAYSVAEVRALLDAAKALRGNGRRAAWKQADFWQAAVRLSWDTAARRGDLLALRWSDLSVPDRVISWQQNKTGGHQTARLSPETIELLMRIRGPCDRLLPWPHKVRGFSESFLRLVRTAGLTRGSLKWLRRASATSVEKQQRGAGRFQLGHKSQGVAEAHYLDASQLPINWPMPEKL